MPKFLTQFSYTVDGVKGLFKEGGPGRRTATERLIKSLGGTMEAYYFAFGETDGFVIADLPDNASMSAIALTVGARGAVTVKTTVLITPEQVEEALKKT